MFTPTLAEAVKRTERSSSVADAWVLPPAVLQASTCCAIPFLKGAAARAASTIGSLKTRRYSASEYLSTGLSVSTLSGTRIGLRGFCALWKGTGIVRIFETTEGTAV